MTSRAAVQHLFADTGMAGRVIRSSGFTVLKFGGQNALRLASNLILTRLLFPEAFGIMAIIQVVLTGVAMFSDFGLRSSIIQDKRGDDPAFLNTAWTLQILRGFVLGGAVALAAAPVAAFYDTPILAELLLVSACVPVIQGFASTRLATASRKLFIGRMVALHLSAQAAGIVVMIALAWWLESVWALVLGTLVGPALVAGLSHVVIPGIRNRITLERDALGRMFGFGKYIFLATIAGFLINQGDKAVLAKFVSLEALAIYNIAFFLASAPMMLGRALDKAVLFPLYARRPPDASDSNRQKINQARRAITGVLMAGLAVFALFGDALVRVLYDERYHDAAPLIILVAVAALPSLIVATYPSLPLAMGNSRRYTVLMVAHAVLLFALTYVGARAYGVVGAILAQPVGALLFYPALVAGVRPTGGWDPRHDALYAGLALMVAALVLIVQPEFTGWLIAQL